MRGTHVHVERSTTDKLEDVLTEAWTSAAVAGDIRGVEHHWLGGRDWIVVATHFDHDVEETSIGGGQSYWYTTGLSTGNSTFTFNPPAPMVHPLDAMGLRAEVSETRLVTLPDGAVDKTGIAGCVEDVDRTWIMWLGTDGRPRHLWLKRDGDGGVIGQDVIPVGPVSEGVFEVSSRSVDPWMVIKKRNTSFWGSVRRGCVVEEHGNAWVLQEVSPVQELGRGVGRYGFTKCVAVQMTLANPREGANEPVFVVRGSHESVLQICELTEADLARVRKGETARVRAEDYA